MRPLDIVRSPRGGVGLVTEVGEHGEVSVTFFQNAYAGEKTAWWSQDELTWLDSLPRVLANRLAHPFGQNRRQGDREFSQNGI